MPNLLNPIGATNITRLTSNPYNPSNSFIGPTINAAATAPSNPKTQYVQSQVANKTQQNLSGNFANVNGTIYNKQNGQAYSTPDQFAQAAGINPNNINWNNLTFDTSWKPQNTAQTSQNPSLSTPANTGMTGYSGGVGSTSGVYDPYNSPEYQNYLNQYVKSQLPSLNSDQINSAITGGYTGLQQLQQDYANKVKDNFDNPNLSQGALTGQNAALAQNLANLSVPYQTQISLGQQQQQQAGTAYAAPLNTANTEAGYLTGIAQPLAVSPGSSIVLPNPATGQASSLAYQPSYSAVANPLSPSGITTFNQQTGAQNSGFGTTPPTLGGNDLASQYMQNPIIAGYVQATRNSNGDMNAAGVPSQYQAAVNTVLQSQSGGQYSPGNASINQANLTAQQQAAQQLKPAMDTAISHLSDLQSLANAVGYSNSPISNNIRSQISGTLLTDPSITNLQSAIGVVRSEVAKVLGGGTPTVASQAEAADAIPSNLSPQNMAGVISKVEKLMQDKLSTYTNPAQAVQLPTGLQMPSNSTPPPAGTFGL